MLRMEYFHSGGGRVGINGCPGEGYAEA